MAEIETLPKPDEPLLLHLHSSHLIWVDFDSDVSDDEDWVESPDDQRAEREAQREREMRAFREAAAQRHKERMAEIETLLSPVHEPLLLHLHSSHLMRAEIEALLHQQKWWNFDSDVSDDEDWVKSPDSQMSERSLESNDSDVSLKSDQSKGGLIDFKDRDSLRMAEREAQRKKEKWVDFDSDVSDDEDWVESPDDQMSERSLESSDSGVSLKSDQSKGGLIDFKDRDSPRWWNFDPDVSAVEDFNKL